MFHQATAFYVSCLLLFERLHFSHAAMEAYTPPKRAVRNVLTSAKASADLGGKNVVDEPGTHTGDLVRDNGRLVTACGLAVNTMSTTSVSGTSVWRGGFL
jgi:predicted RNA methylase